MHSLEQLAAYRVEDLRREAALERLARSAEPPVRGPRMAQLVVFALLVTTLLAPTLAHAQTSDDNSFDVPQGGAIGTPDPQTLASAYGDLSVFILNVAAGNDGVPRQPEAEQAFLDVFAQPVLAAYASLSPDDLQGLTQLAVLDGQIHQAWPGLPEQQRLAVRDQWAAAVQSQVANAPCELFDAMARAQLLPSFGQYKQPNLDRLVACWNEHPELATDRQGNALQRGQSGAGNHAAFIGLMNANTMNFAAGMNIASNIGGGAYSYTVK